MRTVMMKTASLVAVAWLLTMFSMTSYAAAEGGIQTVSEKTADLFTYDRIYTGEDGETHFDKVVVNFKVFQYANDVPPVWVQTSGRRPADSVHFMAAPTGWDGSANHPPPRRQFFVVLTGAVAFTATDGETKIFHPGQILLMDDHIGKGHGSFNAGQGVAIVMAVPLPDDEPK